MTKILKRGVPAAILTALVVAGILLTISYYRTIPHELMGGEVLTVGPGGQLELALEGCFLRSEEWPSIYLKATSLEPSVTLSLHSRAEGNVRLVMQNVSADILTIDGAESFESVPDEKQTIVEMSLDFEQAKALRWRLPSSAGEYSFFVLGDNSGVYDILEKIRDDIIRDRPLFVISLGDLTRYGTGEEMLRHEEYARSVPVPYFTLIGNHDIERGKSAAAYHQVFGPTYYSFPYGPSLFVMLDNSRGYISPRQLMWLRNRLDEASDASVKFSFAHQPPHDPRRGRHHGMKPVIGGGHLMMELLAAGDVDYLLCGHLHTYFEFEQSNVHCIITGNTTRVIGGDPLHLPHYMVFSVTADSIKRTLCLIETEIVDEREALR